MLSIEAAMSGANGGDDRKCKEGGKVGRDDSDSLPESLFIRGAVLWWSVLWVSEASIGGAQALGDSHGECLCEPMSRRDSLVKVGIARRVYKSHDTEDVFASRGALTSAFVRRGMTWGRCG
jgi:hypothetical protein